MTDTFKDTTMEYLVGKLVAQQSPNQVYFEQNKSLKNDFQTEMENSFQYGFTIDGKIQGKSNNNEGLNYSIVFGKYKKNAADSYAQSFMVIIDDNYNIIQTITKYSNNENFGKILGLNVGEDGRFFALEKDTNGYYRFVLMNNIVAKLPSQENYQVVQRQTYRVSDQYYFENGAGIVEHVEIIKHPESARYVVWGFLSNYDQIKCLEFVINVGAENEWNYVGGFTDYVFFQNPAYDWYINWDDEDRFLVNIRALNESTYEGITSIYYSQLVKYYTDTKFNYIESFPPLVSNIPSTSTIDYKQLVFKDANTTYSSISVDNKYYLFKNGIKPAFIEIQMPTPDNIKGYHLLEKNGNIFVVYQNGSTTYAGLIIDDNIFGTEIENFTANKTLNIEEITNVFSLYTLYVQMGDYINIFKIPYLDLRNNQSYIDTTTLTPYFGKLYDDNGDLLFARTLYNKYVSGQTTTSVIQIPNQYLNNITIQNEKLIGKTYCELNDDNETFEKNQYEEVFVNFANTLNMINENIEENPILNVAGATRLNQSISNTNDYEDTQATKFKVNYADGTSMINNFLATQIELLPNETRKYRYTWQVFNPQENGILSIDIISEDETTTYQHITDIELDPGKLYTLTQDVYMI